MQHNASAIWNQLRGWAWPTVVLIDKKGIIRYSPIGEGADEQAQSMIAKLLSSRVTPIFWLKPFVEG